MKNSYFYGVLSFDRELKKNKKEKQNKWKGIVKKNMNKKRKKKEKDDERQHTLGYGWAKKPKNQENRKKIIEKNEPWKKTN